MGQNDQSFFVGLKAFIADGERLLILEDKEGQWELPGGKIQIGENIPVALNREIREELGEKVEIERGPIFHCWIRQPNPAKDFFIFLVGFSCIFKSGEIEISPEHKDFRWITKEEITNLQFENTYEHAIRKYFQDLGN